MLIKDQAQSAFTTLKEAFGYTNVMAAPKLEKIIINARTGKRSRTDRHFNDMVADRLAKITGQKSVMTLAKKSVAGFKIRTGDVVGQKVTLRGERMYGFLNKLIHIAFPRTKDFRGISRDSVDNMGNLTLAIREHSIFPETGDEDIKDIFGLSVTIVSTAKNKEEGIKFYEHLGFPFPKEEGDEA